ncbi:CotH kinase family protein [Anaerotignum sp.]|uniref:CotH kinase family protein n=1 Tax=Anaerotignum sp. TaxID=2039241 RepID=UPI0027148084|nr:CotH kinase family protein [Anaerotignum sp.]
MKRTVPLLFSLTLLFGTTACSKTPTESQQTEATSYANALFDDSYVHTIDIQIDQDNWADLLENPMDKTKYEANVTIDGNSVENVSFSTKGNSSLSQVAGSDSDRYSFKINFGKFVDEQTYDGLDKLNLQNIFSDATYMKDYLSYEIMEECGVAAPLKSYVSLSINGELYGLYLALEDLDASFLERNYGEDYGQLYKPETAMLGNMKQRDKNNMDPPDGMEMPDGAKMPDGTEESEEMNPPENNEQVQTKADGENSGAPKDMGQPHDGGMGMGGTASGADLAYTDDEISSYSDIFDNAQTDPTDEDKVRVIAALKQLSTGENLETCVDVDAVIRYFVAHNFVINGDSYTGSMLHNYGLYEENGVLTMLPWDYNLAFGGFHMNGDATSIINEAIDTPLNSESIGKRPMWDKIMANDENIQLYHQYFNTLITDYFESGEFESTVNRISTMIRPYVENDPTAWYSVDEFDTAVDTITQFCLLRAQSIRSQLDGTLASTTEAQEATNLIDASGIDISAMGSQEKGNGHEGGQGDFPGEMPRERNTEQSNKN